MKKDSWRYKFLNWWDGYPPDAYYPFRTAGWSPIRFFHEKKRMMESYDRIGRLLKSIDDAE